LQQPGRRGGLEERGEAETASPATATVAAELTTATPLACAVSMSYQTGDGTATAWQDCTARTWTATFRVGRVNDAMQTIRVLPARLHGLS